MCSWKTTFASHPNNCYPLAEQQNLYWWYMCIYWFNGLSRETLIIIMPGKSYTAINRTRSWDHQIVKPRQNQVSSLIPPMDWYILNITNMYELFSGNLLNLGFLSHILLQSNVRDAFLCEVGQCFKKILIRRRRAPPLAINAQLKPRSLKLLVAHIQMNSANLQRTKLLRKVGIIKCYGLLGDGRTLDSECINF